MDKLIFDRTASDVEYARNNPSAEEWLKGCYNYIDLNRVEEWCKYLSDLLNSYGYVNLIDEKTNWNVNDIQTVEQMERYLKNVKTLIETFAIKKDTPNLPETMNKLTYSQANDIEKILFDINNLIQYTEKNFVFSGVANCGQNRLWQQRFRRLKYRNVKRIFRNIIPDSSFENELWNNAVYSTAEKKFGNKSLYFPTGTTYVPNIEIERPIVGHKYYGRRYIKSNGDNQPADSRFEVWGADGANMNWVYAWNNGNHPEWDFSSAIHEIAGVDYPETDRTIIRCFNVNTTADTWVDSLMLIDLTETFGEGKEPTLEWCDENIPYIEGTEEITVKEEIKE